MIEWLILMQLMGSSSRCCHEQRPARPAPPPEPPRPMTKGERIATVVCVIALALLWPHLSPIDTEPRYILATDLGYVYGDAALAEHEEPIE